MGCTIIDSNLRQTATSSPVMQKAQSNTANSSSALSKWEDAGEKLAAALSTYLESCEFLETFSDAQEIHDVNLSARIGSSIKKLRTQLSDDVTRSKLILTRLYNKISSRFHSLPKEVQAEIFMDVVYAPSPDEVRFPSMVNCIKRIFERLHCLLAVCSTWRKIVIELSNLWSVIPVSQSLIGLPKLEAATRSLQRSRAWTSDNNRLHLAAVLCDMYHTPCSMFRDKGLPRITSINIETRYDCTPPAFFRFLGDLIKSQLPLLISEVSIHEYSPKAPTLRYPKVHEYFDFYMFDEERALFKRSIESLTILRLRNVKIHWGRIAFSDNLVDMHLQSVVLGDHAKLGEFLFALESAPELRNLKIISVVAAQDQFDDQDSMPEQVELPKLELLMLADLSFNVLKYVLGSVAPGSYQTKVSLTHKTEYNHTLDPDSDNDSDLELHSSDKVGRESILELLEDSNIDTIFFDARERGPQWVRKQELRSLLGSLPNLNTLIMVGWKWNSGSIRALEYPRSDKPFPTLTELYVLGGFISDAHLLPRVVASHSIQKMVLDSNPDAFVGGNRQTIIAQLRDTVPDFRLIDGLWQMDEFNYDSWRLW